MIKTKAKTKAKVKHAESKFVCADPQAELARLARAQNVKPYKSGDFRKRYPSLAEEGTWDGFEEFIRKLRKGK